MQPPPQSTLCPLLPPKIQEKLAPMQCAQVFILQGIMTTSNYFHQKIEKIEMLTNATRAHSPKAMESFLADQGAPLFLQ